MDIIMNLLVFLFLIYTLFTTLKTLKTKVDNSNYLMIIQSASLGVLLHCTIETFTQLILSLIGLFIK